MLTDVIVAIVVAGYLLGSIPVADLVTASRRRGVDLRTVGDRNPGYWNAKEQLGQRRALPILIGDVAKGALAAGLGWLVAAPGQWWFPVVGTGAAMVGHCWPLFAHFRGGRAVATFVGGALVMSPVTGAIAVGVLLVVWAVVRSFAWAVRSAFIAYPLIQLAVDSPARTAGTGALLTLIGVRFALAARAHRVPAPAPVLTASGDAAGDGGDGDGVGRG